MAYPAKLGLFLHLQFVYASGKCSGKSARNLKSLSFNLNDNRKHSLPHPLPFESVVWGVCVLETHLWQSYAWENSNNEYKFMGIKCRKIVQNFVP